MQKGGQRHANSKEKRREEADRSGAYCTVKWMNQSVWDVQCLCCACLYRRTALRQCDSHSHMYTDECMQSAEAETISNSHRKVKTKSAGQAKCRREGSEPCVGGVTEPEGWLKGGFNPGLHVCCMTDCLSICICSISLPSPSACTPTSKSQVNPLRGSRERAVAGKESPMAGSTSTWPRIISHPNTGRGTARHGTAKQTQ